MKPPILAPILISASQVDEPIISTDVIGTVEPSEWSFPEVTFVVGIDHTRTIRLERIHGSHLSDVRTLVHSLILVSAVIPLVLATGYAFGL